MNRVIKLFSIMSCVIAFTFCIISIKQEKVTTPVRNVELSQQDVDYQSFFNTFENSNLSVNQNIGVFTGTKQISDFDLDAIDAVAETDLDLENQSIDFSFTFNQNTSMVIIEATICSSGETSSDSLVGYVFENDNGDIDAIITLDDDSTIFLSELETYYVENCGWLSKLIKAAITTVVTAVVCVVVPVAIPAIVTATAVMATIELTEDCFAVRNYNNNKSQTQPYGLIYDQDLYHTWKMGNQYLDINGCGAIATYNVMYLLGERQELYDTVYYYDATGGTLLFGYLGTDPTSISSYFKAQKITCKSYSSISSLQNDVDDISHDKYIIMCFWNDKNDITRAAHYIAIRKIGSSYYQAYNSYTEYGTTLEYFYKNNYKDGSYIGGWIVG